MGWRVDQFDVLFDATGSRIGILPGAPAVFEEESWNPFENLADAMGLLEKFYEWDMQRVSTDWGYMYSVHVTNNNTKCIYPAMGRILNDAIIQAVERASEREGGGYGEN